MSIYIQQVYVCMYESNVPGCGELGRKNVLS